MTTDTTHEVTEADARAFEQEIADTAARVPAHAGGGQYDHARRRQSKRSGRQRGCWVYIPGEELQKTGHGHPDPPPAYRVWGSDRGRVVVQLYKDV